MFCSNEKLLQWKLTSCFGKFLLSDQFETILNFPLKKFDSGVVVGGRSYNRKITPNSDYNDYVHYDIPVIAIGYSDFTVPATMLVYNDFRL